MCNSVIDTFVYIVKYIPKHPTTKLPPPKKKPNAKPTKHYKMRNQATERMDRLKGYAGTISRKAPAMDIAIPMD